MTIAKNTDTGRKKKKRIGRGQGSGQGCTAGRGNKGQQSRSGYSKRYGFEGGQTPLFQRIPTRGFNNVKYGNQYLAINVGALVKLFPEGGTLGFEDFRKAGAFSSKKT